MLVSTSKKRGGARQDSTRPQWALHSRSRGVGLELINRSQHLQLLVDGPAKSDGSREETKNSPTAPKRNNRFAAIASATRAAVRSRDSTKIRIRLRYEIESISRIDTANQTFEARFAIFATWRDTTINLEQYRKLDRKHQEEYLEQCWRPRRIKFQNEIESNYNCTFELVDQEHRVHRHHRNGSQCNRSTEQGEQEAQVMNTNKSSSLKKSIGATKATTRKSHDNSQGPKYEECGSKVCLSVFGQAKFLTHMSLEMFPFDYQDLTLSFAMLSRDREIIFVKPTKRNSNQSGCGGTLNHENFVQSEWKAHEPSEFVELQTQQQIPVYHICLRVERLPGHYITNVFIPFIIINILTWTAYTIPFGQTGSRLQVVLTMILTSVTFKLVVADQLPTISYNTLCDHYILSGILFQTIIALHIGIEFNIVGANASYHESFTSALTLASLWLLVQVYFVLRVYSHRRHQEFNISTIRTLQFVRTVSMAKLRSNKSLMRFRKSFFGATKSLLQFPKASVVPESSQQPFRDLSTIGDGAEGSVSPTHLAFEPSSKAFVVGLKNHRRLPPLRVGEHRPRQPAAKRGLQSLFRQSWRFSIPKSMQSRREWEYSQKAAKQL